MTTAHLLQLEPAKTYKTRANAIAAVQKVYGANHAHAGTADARYVIMQNEAGRFFPLFIGTSAIAAGAHFHFASAN